MNTREHLDRLIAAAERDMDEDGFVSYEQQLAYALLIIARAASR